MLSRTCRSNSAAGVSWTRPPMANPPTRLTTARSGTSGRLAACWTAAAAEAGSSRSARTVSSRSPAGRRSSSRSVIQGTTTRQPASRNPAVTALPRPPEPPVTSTVASIAAGGAYPTSS
jgi:hypothetical protein